MENKETHTNFSDYDNEKRIQCLEDKLAKVNAKVTSLEELLMLAENLLSRCTCPELKEQILSLLNTVHCVLPKTDAVDSLTVSGTSRTDVATQCEGEYFQFGPGRVFV